MVRASYLDDVKLQFKMYRDLADRSIVRVNDKQFLETYGEGSHRVAVPVKHTAGSAGWGTTHCKNPLLTTHHLMTAFNRQLTHHAYRVGRIVSPAKRWVGQSRGSWRVPQDWAEQFDDEVSC